MRGYGQSDTHTRHEDFAQGADRWTCSSCWQRWARQGGLDRPRLGQPVVWNVAAHHPDKTVGVASLCVPCRRGQRIDTVVPLSTAWSILRTSFPPGSGTTSSSTGEFRQGVQELRGQHPLTS